MISPDVKANLKQKKKGAVGCLINFDKKYILSKFEIYWHVFFVYLILAGIPSSLRLSVKTRGVWGPLFKGWQ